MVRLLLYVHMHMHVFSFLRRNCSGLWWALCICKEKLHAWRVLRYYPYLRSEVRSLLCLMYFTAVELLNKNHTMYYVARDGGWIT